MVWRSYSQKWLCNVLIPLSSTGWWGFLFMLRLEPWPPAVSKDLISPTDLYCSHLSRQFICFACRLAVLCKRKTNYAHNGDAINIKTKYTNQSIDQLATLRNTPICQFWRLIMDCIDCWHLVHEFLVRVTLLCMSCRAGLKGMRFLSCWNFQYKRRSAFRFLTLRLSEMCWCCNGIALIQYTVNRIERLLSISIT